jgi:hypothetical protein
MFLVHACNHEFKTGREVLRILSSFDTMISLKMERIHLSSHLIQLLSDFLFLEG